MFTIRQGSAQALPGFERVFRLWISFYGLGTQGGLTPLAAEVPRWDGPSRVHRRAGLAHGVAGDLQFDAMTVVNDAIQNRVRQSGLADDFMMPPFLIA